MFLEAAEEHNSRDMQLVMLHYQQAIGFESLEIYYGDWLTADVNLILYYCSLINIYFIALLKH